jgi:5-methylthioribose kinase
VLLDAEIAHVGDPAFDLGTLFAHLWLPAVARGAARDAESAVARAGAAYTEANPRDGADLQVCADRYAALEMARRTIGAARVAAVADAAASLRVLDFAERLLGV